MGGPISWRRERFRIFPSFTCVHLFCSVCTRVRFLVVLPSCTMVIVSQNDLQPSIAISTVISISNRYLSKGIDGSGLPATSRCEIRTKGSFATPTMTTMEDELDVLLAHEEEEEAMEDVPMDVLQEMEDAARGTEDGGGGAANATKAAVEQVVANQGGEVEEKKETAFDGKLRMESCEYVAPNKRLLDLEGESLRVTSHDGELVYCKVFGRKEWEGVQRENMDRLRKKRNASLLRVPIGNLLSNIEQKRAHAAMQKANALKNMFETGVEPRQMNDTASEGKAMKNTTSKRKVLNELWVDKYSPKNFLELLSDERINRDVLHWLKNWDPCVFGRDPPKPKQPPSSYSSKKYGKQEYKTFVNPCHEMGSDGRPKHKVLLIAGPPGYGKTTLAHILAKHCGYRPFEINASDNRSSTSLHQRVLDAIQMQSLIGDKRPNCIIVDEIDGALGGEGRGGIDALLKIVTAGETERTATEGTIKDKRARRQDRVGKLQRPVICICNDLYAPALRPLREIAAIVRFKKPNPARLTSRLRRVCDVEKVRVEGRALSVLSTNADGDIRSCLNTLQFLHRQGKSVTTTDVAGLGVGQKDLTRGVFDAWTAIFQASTVKNTAFQKGRTGAGPSQGFEPIPQEQQEFYNTLSLLQSVGDTELVLGGCHENLLRMPYSDLTMKKTCEALEWIGVSESIVCHARLTSDYSLMAYAHYGPLAVKRIASCPDRVQLEWPKAYSTYHRQLQSNKGLLIGWLQHVEPRSVPHISPKSAALDMLTHLLNALSVNFRTVASNLQTTSEKDAIKNLVGILISYGLAYANGGIDDFTGSRTYLDPAIDRLHRYKDLPGKKRHITDTQRQIITHELTVERIRRANAKCQHHAQEIPQIPKEQEPQLVTELTVRDDAVQMSRSKLPGQVTWLDEMRNLAVKRTLGVKDGELEGKPGKKLRLMFKFNEGVTREVRMRVKFTDLL